MNTRTLMQVVAMGFALAVVAPAPGVVRAAGQHDHEHGQAPQSAQTDGGQMKMGHKMMGQMKMDEMAAKKKANTERLAVLMNQIKTATGDAKLAAMTEAIALLVDERAAMQEHCATMRATMMAK
jgi:hypothetical protein